MASWFCFGPLARSGWKDYPALKSTRIFRASVEDEAGGTKIASPWSAAAQRDGAGLQPFQCFVSEHLGGEHERFRVVTTLTFKTEKARACSQVVSEPNHRLQRLEPAPGETPRVYSSTRGASSANAIACELSATMVAGGSARRE